MRQHISVRGARENNLKNVSVDIPRDKLVVITGLSGSGKSSLAFDTLYAEGQRRFMESLSAWAKRFVQQLKKPSVEAVLGLSPVISIEQKTTNKNPRSTVGTMTDIGDYLRLLFANLGTARCLHCERVVPVRTSHQIAEHVLSLPEGTAVEVCAPVSKVYGEDWAYVLADIRTKGCRRVRIDGEVHDLSDEIELDEDREYAVEVIADRFVVKRAIEKQLVVSLESAIKIGEGYVRIQLVNGDKMAVDEDAFFAAFACPEHRLTMGELGSWYFGFNEPDSACLTCSGLGTYLMVHTGLLVPDPSRSILGGAFVPEAFRYDKNTWHGRMMYSLSQHYGFALDVPFADLSESVKELLFHGTKGEKVTMLQTPGGAQGDRHLGKPFRWDGIVTDIERRYRHYRKQQTAHSHMEEYLKKVMVEHVCPDCGGTRLKPQRLRVTVDGASIHDLGQMSLEELNERLQALAARPDLPRGGDAGRQIIREITARLELLVGIGLDYLSLNRKAGTLSGGESQRIRLSTQISSELMGMLYVLDEPSIGLHPKDNTKLITTLRRLRDIGNTVIVVEHDEETIRAADWVIEMGPGPGVHGGEVVATGTVDDLTAHPDSLTGAFLAGRRQIEAPNKRRPAKAGYLTVRGAKENNLRSVDVAIPLGVVVAVTGASGSGKSTLVNEILFKKLWSLKYDSRVLSGAHDALEGHDLIGDVINIDQAPIGRTPRSNPATYIGFYDDIRTLFAETEEAKARGYTPSRFSFNVKGGRCEECGGEGVITTHLHFMPDVESPCPSCKGTRYNAETLEIVYKGKTIADVLGLSIEEGAEFFADRRKIAHKLRLLTDLGLGYLTLGHPAPTLSGGEAQRVKLANELGKMKRGARSLYILDEPTTGLHLADIQRLLECLNRLVDAGNTVLVIEHHLDVIKTADWVIDLGPDGGKRGGEVVATGTPEEVAKHPSSHTGRFLRDVLYSGSPAPKA
jgi:excinuclease ABC subunit A